MSCAIYLIYATNIQNPLMLKKKIVECFKLKSLEEQRVLKRLSQQYTMIEFDKHNHNLHCALTD